MILKHTRGDTFILNISLTNPDNTPVDLTGASLVFSIKHLQTDVAYIYTGTMTIISATGGTASITIPAAITAAWAVQDNYYDVQLTNSSSQISTILNDKIKIIYDITI